MPVERSLGWVLSELFWGVGLASFVNRRRDWKCVNGVHEIDSNVRMMFVSRSSYVEGSVLA